jgi:Holliday junction resolvase RusA-like endonuclease
MALELPVPPSANVYWRKFRNRMVRSDEAEAYANLVVVRGWNQGARPIPLKYDVEVSVRWHRERRSGDLDNRLKCLLDSLQGVAYVKDSQVRKLTAERFDGERPRVEVIVAVAA